MNILRGKAQLAGKPLTQFPWRAPPPNIYCLKNLVGFIDHDPTKKLAPAYSLVRYVYPPKPKVKVSTPPFIKALRRKQKCLRGKKSGPRLNKTSTVHGVRRRFRRRLSDKSIKDIEATERDVRTFEDVESAVGFKSPPLKYRLTRRTSSASDYFLTAVAQPTDSKCLSCDVPIDLQKAIDKKEKFKGRDIHGVQMVTVGQDCADNSVSSGLGLKKKRSLRK